MNEKYNWNSRQTLEEQDIDPRKLYDKSFTHVVGYYQYYVSKNKEINSSSPSFWCIMRTT